MKKSITLILLTLLFASCGNSKVEEFTSYEHNEAWYWIIQFDKDATEADVKETVNKWANPNQTSYFYAYDKEWGLSEFKNKDMNFPKFRDMLLQTPPEYGFYKMPNDSKIYDDAMWLLEQSK